MRDKTILLISPEPWGENFVSKHHYANYLAKYNSVFFLNPPSSFAKNPLKGVSAKQKRIKEGLVSVDYLNLVPRLNSLPKFVQKSTYKKQAQLIQEFLGIEKFDIVWSFDPNRFYDLSIWNAEKTIYHTVDFHPNSPFEKDSILSADIFLGVTELILKEHTAYRKGVEISHAADLDGFESEFTINLPGTNKIRAIYTGNFHQHINYNLLIKLVEANPMVDFMMIGPTKPSNLAAKNTISQAAYKELNVYSNIHFIGSVPSNQLQSYLKKCDVNLVLFKKENEIIHCSPHKLMGYFYSGNITLSNYISAHKNTSEKIITMVDSEKELLNKFADIQANLSKYNSPELKELRRSFAIKNSYENKIIEIEKLLYS